MEAREESQVVGTGVEARRRSEEKSRLRAPRRDQGQGGVVVTGLGEGSTGMDAWRSTEPRPGSGLLAVAL